MNATALVEALQQAPFRPFEIHVDGRVIPIHHPEQVLLTPAKTTLVAAMPDDSIRIVDVSHISSIDLIPRRGKSPKA